MTFGVASLRVWSCLPATQFKSWGRELDTLSCSCALLGGQSREGGRETACGWLVLFTAGQNGWMKAAASVTASDLFCIHELVFWLVIILLWVFSLGRNCVFSSGSEWCNFSAPGPSFFCLLCCPDICGVCCKLSSAYPVLAPWWAVLCEHWAQINPSHLKLLCLGIWSQHLNIWAISLASKAKWFYTIYILIFCSLRFLRFVLLFYIYK